MKYLSYNNPYISTIPEHSNLMSIINKDNENWSWFLNYFIQLMVNRNTEYSLDLNFCYGDNYNLVKNSPIVDTYCLLRNIIISEGIGEFIKRAVDAGYFVYFSVDVYEIEAYEWYHGMHMNHDLMVVGYDGAAFDIADFFNMKYSVKKCSLEQLEAGYANYNVQRGNSGFPEIYLLKARENYTYTFNIALVKTLISEYLDGVNSNDHFHPIENAVLFNEDLYAFGVNVYHVLKEYIRNSGGDELRIRSFHILYEHKRMMLELLRFLCDREYLRNSDDNIAAIRAITNDALLLRNMVLKYNITKNTRLIDTMIAKVNSLLQSEVNLFEALKHDICDVPQNFICENVISKSLSRNIKYSGIWEATKDNLMASSDRNASAGYIFKGNKVIISLMPKNYERRVRVICDGVVDVKDYLLASEESQLIIDGLNYGYHYITVYNTDTCDIELVQIECKTNVTDMSDRYNICEFEGIDSVTNGCWKSKYGKGGYDIYTYKNTFDYYVKLVYSGFTNKVWNLPKESDNGQALEVDCCDKIAACKFFGDKAVIDVVIAGDETRMLSFYVMDCYDFERRMNIRAIDADSKEVLDDRYVSARNAGIYVKYIIKGHVIFEFENQGKAIGVISAVFID